MKIAAFALTKGGRHLAEKLSGLFENIEFINHQGTIADTLAQHWKSYDGFLCIMAAGIVVRSIAPLLQDKKQDPCVLVMDELGKNVIPLLSGHLGGGNQLARAIAYTIGANPALTTASDTIGLVPLDLWAAHHQLVVSDPHDLTRASGLLIEQGTLNLYTDLTIDALPPGLIQVEDVLGADILISNRTTTGGAIRFYPRNLVIGMGCNRGTPREEFVQALQELLGSLSLSPLSVRNIASIDVKNDEQGLLDFAAQYEWRVDFFSRDQINRITNVEVSDAAMKAVGAIGVAEPTALLSAGNTTLFSRKRKWQNITMAVAEVPFSLSAQVQERKIT